MLADLLQSGIEDINSLEKPYIFAEVGRMAAEESSFIENFLARSESSKYIGLFLFSGFAIIAPFPIGITAIQNKK